MPRTFISKDELDHEVLYVLMNHQGEFNKIDRWELAGQVFDLDAWQGIQNDDNTWDRQCRQSIERLRHAGHLICNTGDGKGYYIALDIAEYQKFRSIYGAHAFPILEAISAMDKSAMRKGWTNPLQEKLI